MPRKVKGERRHGAGIQVYTRVRGQLLIDQLPLSSTPAERKARREELRKDHLRTLPAKTARGTFAADVEAYLPTLADRPTLRHARAVQLAWWEARFGHRARHSVKRHEWMTALVELAATLIVNGSRRGRPRSATSVRHYRTAVFHLFTTLDGKDAPNPFRDIPPPRMPDAEPRGLPYPLIEAIFDAMPDRRYGKKLTSAQIDAIRARLVTDRKNLSAIGRDFKVSETMIRKIRDGRYGHHDTAGTTKARLRVAAYVGLPKAQIERLRPEHVNFEESTVMILGRRKGKGTRTVRLPLIPQGAEALRIFFATGAAGQTYSASSASRTWWRAIRTMVDRMAATDYRAAKLALDALRAFKARPHDLRHSFLTAYFLKTGNIRATQEMAMHADGRQTQRYTLAAVDPQLKALAAALRL